jgi:hypothetical protein
MAGDFREADRIDIASESPGMLPDDIEGVTQVRDQTLFTLSPRARRRANVSMFALGTLVGVCFGVLIAGYGYLEVYLPLVDALDSERAKLVNMQGNLNLQQGEKNLLRRHKEQLEREKDVLSRRVEEEKLAQAVLLRKYDEMDAKLRTLVKQLNTDKSSGKKSKARRSSRNRKRKTRR